MEKDSKSLYQAIIAVQGAVENVTRDTQGQVGNQKYKYATLDAVLNMLRPLLKENGLAVVQSVHGPNLHTTICHESGETMECGLYPLGNHEKPQERGSALTYARRYTLTSIFGIAQEDDDGAAASNAPVKRVFPSAAKRKDWEGKLTKLIENSPSIEDLRGVWDEHMPILLELKSSSDDYERVSYEHLEKLKNQAKETLSSLNGSIPEHMR